MRTALRAAAATGGLALALGAALAVGAPASAAASDEAVARCGGSCGMPQYPQYPSQGCPTGTANFGLLNFLDGWL